MSAEEQGRILAVDLGARRVGLAISDPMGNFAVGLPTLEVASTKETIALLIEQCKSNNVCQIVMGMPVNMNGTEGPAAQKVRYVAQMLTEATNIPVAFFDERLTSVLAMQTLREQGIKPSKNRGLIDQAAAIRILQDYLDRKRFQNS